MPLRKVILSVGLVISLLVLGIGAAWFGLGHWTAVTVRPVVPPPVIPPGRENAVMTWLGPVMKNGFAGLGVGNISLEKSQIRLQLAPKVNSSPPLDAPCTLPDWAHAPGTLVLVVDRVPEPPCPTNVACGWAKEKGLVLTWAVCPTGTEKQDEVRHRAASEWISALAQRDHDAIWQPSQDLQKEAKEQQAGLLTPIVLRTGMSKVFVAQMLLATALITSMLVGLVLRWRMGPSRDTPRAPTNARDTAWKTRWGILGICVIVGIGLRMHAAATIPRDIDEGFRDQYIQMVLSDDHDAWVHPPLYRAVHKAWFDKTGLNENDALWKLRVPSLLFSILALCFLAAMLGTSQLPPVALLPFALAALSPIAVQDSVLARPYGLAMWGATLCLLAVCGKELDEEKNTDWFDWFVALVAFGLTIWTDLVTSLLVGSFMLARWLDSRSFSSKAKVVGRMVTAFCIAVWAIPFGFGVPGSMRASQTIGWPFRSESAPNSAYDQVTGFLWSMFGHFGFANAPGFFLSVFMVALALAFIVYAVRWTRSSSAIGLALLLVLLALVSHRVGMRTRNVVFLPVAFTFVASMALARGPLDILRARMKHWRKAN